jgi:hypothetical protein
MGKRRTAADEGSDPRRGHLLQVRLRELEKETFEAAAELAGIDVSSWVRERLRLAVIRELEAAGQDIPLFNKGGDDKP